jgi:murein DD-endopeptidase
MRTDRYRPNQPPFLLYALLGLSLILNIYLVLDRDAGPNSDAVNLDVPQQASLLPSLATANIAVPTVTARTATPAAAAPVRQASTTRSTFAQSGWKSIDSKVSHSLARTFSKAVGDDSGELAAIFSRIFMWEMDLRKDVLGGDRVQVLYRTGADGKLEIAAASYDSQKLRTTLSAFLYQKPGDSFASYWNEKGQEVPRRLKNSPVNQYQQVTALLGDGRNHGGMDFKAPVGTPVTSPKAGTVTRVNWNTRPNGNCIEVRFTDGTKAKFLHLEETKVRANQHVSAGDLIALSGNTGRSTAPHLHYQLDRGNRNLDPLDYHGTRRRQLSATALQAFSAEQTKWNSMLMDATLLAN